MRGYLKNLNELAPDGLIITDPAVFMIAKRFVRKLSVISGTQANNTNYGTYRFWHELGAKRVVSARELSLEEIQGNRGIFRKIWRLRLFVHERCILLLRALPAQQLFYRQRCESGACTHPLPVEILCGGRAAAGRISAPSTKNERGGVYFLIPGTYV